MHELSKHSDKNVYALVALTLYNHKFCSILGFHICVDDRHAPRPVIFTDIQKQQGLHGLHILLSLAAQVTFYFR